MSNTEQNTLSVTYRQSYRWAVAELAASLPSIVLSGWVLVGTAALSANWVAVLIAVLWVGSGPLVMCWRRLGLGAMALWSARNLPAEYERVNRAWEMVADAAGVPAATSTVWVIGSDAVNGGVHIGGHITVTRHAVEVFTQRQLEALLAHELGHRWQGTATWRSVIRWYRGPFDALVHVAFLPADLLMGRALPHLSAIADRVVAALRYSYPGLVLGSCLIAGPSIVAYATTACLVFLALAVLLGPWGSALALTLAAAQLLARPQLSQRLEYLADRVVVDLGYLDDFRFVLQVLHNHVPGPTGRRTEIPGPLSTHPHLDARLAAAEQYARRLC
ncbi:M48 family metalloprotease [Nocardia sp. NPDC055053]